MVRIFTTTHRASEDLLSDGFRRMLVNACLWAVGLEERIKKNNNIDFVGEYSPKLLTLKAINQR